MCHTKKGLPTLTGLYVMRKKFGGGEGTEDQGSSWEQKRKNFREKKKRKQGKNVR